VYWNCFWQPLTLRSHASAHPHAALATPAIGRAAAATTSARIFDHRPNLDAVQAKIDSFLSLPSSSSSLDRKAVREARDAFTRDLVPFLRTATPRSAGPSAETQQIIRKWLRATRTALETLPSSEHFPFLDLLRLALLDERLGPALDLESQETARLVLETPFPEEGVTERQQVRPTLLVALKLLSNVFASTTATPLLAAAILADKDLRKALTRLLVQGLLFSSDSGDEDSKVVVPVREAAVSFAFSLSRWVAQRRPQWIESEDGEEQAGGGGDEEEEWEAELTSALLEALARERERGRVELGYRLVASIGLILRFSRHHAALAGLALALDSEATLQETKMTLFAQSAAEGDDSIGERKRGREVVDEVLRLWSVDADTD
jgi:hypothetical protein